MSYLPEATGGVVPGTYPGTDPTYFLGKTFDAESPGDMARSSHAAGVGWVFYGNINSPPVVASMTPGITTISCYSANDYFGRGFLDANAGNQKVHCHAWVGSSGGANAFLRDLDRDIDSDGYLSVVGVNHGSNKTVPELLASAYNVLSVGLTNGNHSTGETPVSIDAPGRMKPEVVAPDGTLPIFVSGAVPQVASLAALLFDAADGDPGLSNAFDETEVMKGIIMAGRRRRSFSATSINGRARL